MASPDSSPSPRTSGRGLTTVGRRLAVGVFWLPRLWRRSIQARVVLGTLVLSTVLASLAGWVMMRQVQEGLVAGKQQAALNQAAAGIDTAQSRLDGASTELVGTGPGPLLNSLVEVLAPRDAERDSYHVVLLGPLRPGFTGSPSQTSTRGPVGLDVDGTLPQPLFERVVEREGSWASFSTLATGDREVPAFVVGSQLTLPGEPDTYALFYVFSLAEQENSLAVVQRALITAGSILVVLLATIAWLVTRQVVTPVRLARRISERLAAGRLEERMHVRGEDDIARLGVAFNGMATSLQRQIRQLEELSRVQQRFVSDVSHELRTPLTTVRMAADLIHESRDQFTGSTRRSAELLMTELDRFETLLSDLLEISRFDAGAAVLDLAETDLRAVVRNVVDSQRVLASSKGSELVLRLPEEPVLVHSDVRRVERVVRNLVGNAVAYGLGNDIEITVASSSDAVALTVRDHGIGLREGEETLVFNRFWRADPARVRTGGGTGLGLSIAVEDAALHGGVLDAWGRPGQGTQFRLILPRRPGDEFHDEPLPRRPVGSGIRDTPRPGQSYARFGS